jgi:hypothetical protein
MKKLILSLLLFRVLSCFATVTGIGKDKLPNVYLLSVGINNYTFSPKSFAYLGIKNTVSDAQAFTETIVTDFYAYQDRNATDTAGSKITSFLLLNEAATKDSILKVINYVIEKAGSEDIFIFNFAGFSWTISNKGEAKGHTVLVPFTRVPIIDSAAFPQLLQEGISLPELSSLLDLLKCKKQLVVAEAGFTPDFKEDLVKAIVTGSKDIATLLDKDKIVITTQFFGKDMLSSEIKHGPINHYLTHLSHNIFNLYKSDKGRNEVLGELRSYDFRYFQGNYMYIFVQKEFFTDINLYLKSSGKSRSSELLPEAEGYMDRKIHKKVALVVANNIFDAVGEWDSLPNVTLDCTRFRNVIRDQYGFTTYFLLQPSIDSFYNTLRKISNELDSTSQFILYVAGHGDYDPFFLNDGFMVFKESKFRKADPFRRSYVPYSSLSLMLNNMASKQVMVILDVCFGASFSSSARVKKRSGNEMYENDMANDVLVKKMNYTTRVFISSGGLRSVPDGYTGVGSPFSLKLLEILETRGGDKGYLSSINIFSNVQGVKSQPFRTTFGGDEEFGDFILLPVRK